MQKQVTTMSIWCRSRFIYSFWLYHALLQFWCPAVKLHENEITKCFILPWLSRGFIGRHVKDIHQWSDNPVGASFHPISARLLQLGVSGSTWIHYLISTTRPECSCMTHLRSSNFRPYNGQSNSTALAAYSLADNAVKLCLMMHSIYRNSDRSPAYLADIVQPASTRST